MNGNGAVNRRAAQTLRYFGLGYARDPHGWWLSDTTRARPPRRVYRLVDLGLLESCRALGSADLFRLTPAGLAALASARGAPQPLNQRER
jgi:hypothetical protein